MLCAPRFGNRVGCSSAGNVKAPITLSFCWFVKAKHNNGLAVRHKHRTLISYMHGGCLPEKHPEGTLLGWVFDQKASTSCVCGSFPMDRLAGPFCCEGPCFGAT